MKFHPVINLQFGANFMKIQTGLHSGGYDLKSTFISVGIILQQGNIRKNPLI